ncbi:MAG: DUF624 domain-containing protein [Clostridiales bacterium]|nr:DUF624 domain-containing protein [Clostridiales bacterium]
MAGFFGFFDYTKPGPGVPKNLPPKPRIVVFFEVLQRKFWNIIRLNLMHLVFNLPALALMVVGMQFFFPSMLFPDAGVDLYVRLTVGLCFVCFPILCFGPAQAGATYILRNYSREEHAFLWGDYKEHALKNLKESLLICGIDFAVFLLLSIAVNFYSQMMAENMWAVVALGIIFLAFLMFAMSHIYIYPMLVTFKITVRQLYKNALIFSTIKFLPNLGILLLCAAIMVAMSIVPLIGVVLFIFIANALIGLILNFYAYPTLKKYMIDRIGEDGGGLPEAASEAAPEAGAEQGGRLEEGVSAATIEAGGVAAVGAVGTAVAGARGAGGMGAVEGAGAGYADGAMAADGAAGGLASPATPERAPDMDVPPGAATDVWPPSPDVWPPTIDR